MRLALVLLLSLAACSHVENIDVKPPAPTFDIPFPQSYLIGLPWCAGLAPMVKMMRVERKLTNGEVWRLMGGCVVPVVGGNVVEMIWGKHPAWNEYPIDIAGPDVPDYLKRN